MTTKNENYLEEKLKQEALAAESLLKSWADEIADDDDLAEDIVEGETNLKEIMARVLNQFKRDGELISGITERESALKIRKSRLKARQGRLKAMLGIALSITGRKSIELAEATVSQRKGVAKLVVKEESEVPSQYFVKQDPKLDVKGLTAALKALGEDDDPIPGVELEVGLPSVQIRDK